MIRELAALIVLSFIPVFLIGQTAHYRHSGPMLLNDLKATPGAVANTSHTQLCPKAHTRSIRHVTAEMKKAVCKEYGVPAGMCNGNNYEIDHLIPLEASGSNVITNLWPQPIQQAHIKDRMENAVHDRWCAGKMTLGQVVNCLAVDWYACRQNLGVK
jgi:hypothetical protein